MRRATGARVVPRSLRQAFRRFLTAIALAVTSLAVTAGGGVLWPRAALGQKFSLKGENVQQHANAVLALLGYSVVPDITASALSISNSTTGDPSVQLIQYAGGFTVSQDFPLYLEGGIGASRYDPIFIASNGGEERPLPLKWTSVGLTGGVGWDFPITPELKFRPIINIALGHVESDLSLANRVLENQTGLSLDFLNNGRLNAYGYGGSVMLDYEHYRTDYEIDVEARYTYMRLESYGNTSDSVKGRADVPTASLWTRWRAPTGATALDRPVRYVLEYAYSYFLGDQGDILGFNNLHSVGAGFELDTSAHGVLVTRVRLVGRYRFGDNVTGWGISLAVSF